MRIKTKIETFMKGNPSATWLKMFFLSYVHSVQSVSLQRLTAATDFSPFVLEIWTFHSLRRLTTGGKKTVGGQKSYSLHLSDLKYTGQQKRLLLTAKPPQQCTRSMI